MNNWSIDQIIDILGVDAALALVSAELPEPAMALEYEWKCGAEGVWWPAEVRWAPLSETYAVRWIYSPEAGEEAVEIVDFESNSDLVADSLRSFARESGDGPSGYGKIKCGDCTYSPAAFAA